jgi:hypothetical protein
VLDHGLGTALATLAASSTVPVQLLTDLLFSRSVKSTLP